MLIWKMSGCSPGFTRCVIDIADRVLAVPTLDAARRMILTFLLDDHEHLAHRLRHILRLACVQVWAPLDYGRGQLLR